MDDPGGATSTIANDADPDNADDHSLARRLTDSLHVITAWADGMIANLGVIPDDELIGIRRDAEGLRHQSWRVVIACDAEIVRRVRDRRGERVADGEGRLAMVRSLASTASVSPSTMYRNVQIANVFGDELLTYQNILPEKEFYEAALRTDRPHETLEHFAQQREADPRFSTWDALKYAKAVREAERGEVPIPTLTEAEHQHEYVCRTCGEVRS